MTTDQALQYVVDKRREMGYSTDLDFESLSEVRNLLMKIDTSKENVDKFVERMF
jgi:hypothetical protein